MLNKTELPQQQDSQILSDLSPHNGDIRDTSLGGGRKEGTSIQAMDKISTSSS